MRGWSRRLAARMVLPVAMAAVTAMQTAAPALAEVVASGVVSGEVDFSPPGVPPAGQPCIATSFTFSGTAQAVVVISDGNSWAGALGITGAGGSSCEDAAHAIGSVSVSVVSYWSTNGGSFSCSSLSGSYLRAATTVAVIVSGPCTVNGRAEGSMTVIVAGEFVPQGQLGAGIVAPVRTAAFAASFTAAP